MRAMVVLPTPRVPVNRNAWCTRPCVERVAQRLTHMLLANQFGKGPRSPLTRQCQVTHGFEDPWEAARTSRTSAPDIAATAAPFRA